MNRIRISIFSIILVTVFGCKNNDEAPVPTGSCRIDHMTTYRADLTNNTMPVLSNTNFVYNTNGLLTEGRSIYVSGGEDASYYTYDDKNRVVELAISLNGAPPTPTTDRYKYIYNNSGEYIGHVYSYGTNHIDSVAYLSLSNDSIKRISVVHTNLSKDTTYEIHVADANGNLFRQYRHIEHLDTFILVREYEYYSEQMPSNYFELLTPDILPGKNLLKKESVYTYTVLNQDITVHEIYETINYSYEHQNGNIIKTVVETIGPDPDKRLYEISYSCN